MNPRDAARRTVPRDVARVGVLVAREGRSGALVGIGLEDPSAPGRPGFAKLERLLLETALVEVRADGRAAIEELLDARRGARTVRERLAAERTEFGVVAVRFVARFAVDEGAVGGYVHHDGQRGALVAMASDAPFGARRRVAHELAMHVAFHAPRGDSDDARLDRPWFRDPTTPASAELARLLGAEPRVLRAIALRV